MTWPISEPLGRVELLVEPCVQSFENPTPRRAVDEAEKVVRRPAGYGWPTQSHLLYPFEGVLLERAIFFEIIDFAGLLFRGTDKEVMLRLCRKVCA